MYLINCFTRVFDLAEKLAKFSGFAHRLGELIEVRGAYVFLNFNTNGFDATVSSGLLSVWERVIEACVRVPKFSSASTQVLRHGRVGCESSLIRVPSRPHASSTKSFFAGCRQHRRQRPSRARVSQVCARRVFCRNEIALTQRGLVRATLHAVQLI